MRTRRGEAYKTSKNLQEIKNNFNNAIHKYIGGGHKIELRNKISKLLHLYKNEILKINDKDVLINELKFLNKYLDVSFLFEDDGLYDIFSEIDKKINKINTQHINTNTVKRLQTRVRAKYIVQNRYVNSLLNDMRKSGNFNYYINK